MEAPTSSYGTQEEEEEEPNTNATPNGLRQQPQRLSTTPIDEPAGATFPTVNINYERQLFDEMSERGEVSEDDEEEEDEETPKKLKALSSLIPQESKKMKKKSNEGKWSINISNVAAVARVPDRSDDSCDLPICLSKVYKAETIELSEDRLSARSSKGYRMVRATRGVLEGAWYFEIKVDKLGETGHTRLGWSTENGDLQAGVGSDGNSFGYRDVDGSKIYKAMREKYGDEGYVEGDVIGFYINLPDGALYAPKPQHCVWYKGRKCTSSTDGKEELPKVVPGSEISFFRNGVCQGVAFKDIHGGCYYPAASMYTLPNQPNCVVKFNFGPDFEYFPQDFEYRALPRSMIDVPYLAFDGGIENDVCDEKKS